MLDQELAGIILLAVPPALLFCMTAVFSQLENLLGRERGYLLGFGIYWLVWCLAVPLLLLGGKGFVSMFEQSTPLFSRSSILASIVFVLVPAVAVLMYGREFVNSPLRLIAAAVPSAVLNGFCEEVLWRGLFVSVFPDNAWLAVVYPAAGFALWHLAPQQVISSGSKAGFILSTFVLGLAYGLIAYQTGSPFWPSVSHSASGIMALGGALAPSFLAWLDGRDVGARAKSGYGMDGG